MKLLLLICLTLSISSNSFSQSVSNAGEYMDYFSTEYLQIQQDMWDYTRSVSHGRSARKVEKRRAELIQSTGSALNKAKRAKPFNGKTAYRDSVVAYFTMIDIVLREDYGKIVDMEAIAEQSYDAMEAYLMARDLASEKMKEAGKMIGREHRAFAEANEINLIESDSKLGDKIEISNKVYAHYNEVYLIFFKSYKQELYLMEAIAQNDVSAIEQNRNALLETVEEGYQKLTSVEKYANDGTLIAATKELLKFYNKEAEKDVATALNYLETTENFTKIKEAFEAKKEKNRTQEDVDEFNKGVTDVNAAVNEYNAMNEASNKERSDLINKWNKVADKFTTTHVPRGK
jgi:hypothetical protein